MDIQIISDKVENRDFPIELAAIVEVFSRPISPEVIETEDLKDLVMQLRDMFVADGEYGKLEAFVKTLETYQPDIMVSEGKYFYQDFVEYFCAAGDFEKAEYYFEPFIKEPVNDFDFYLLAFNKLLFYQRNTILKRAIQQNYEEVRDCDKLIGHAESLFDSVLYYLAVQEVYEKSDQNFDIKLLEKILTPYDFDFNEEPIDAYQLGFYADTPDAQSLMNGFMKDKDVLLLLLRNVFMKRMLSKGLPFTIGGFIFDNTRYYWDMKSSNKKKGNWKTYFNIKHETFESYLIHLKGSFLAENFGEMMALAWGVAYVYDFLLEAEIIDAEQYAGFQVVYLRTIAEIIGSSLGSLNANAYVMSWPKPEAITAQIWEAQQSIFKKSLAFENDRSLDIIALMEDDFEAFGSYKFDILAAYKESVELGDDIMDLMLSLEEDEFEDEFEDDDDFIDIEGDEIEDENLFSSSKPYIAEIKPGRNEPCPCGSGKKYKKCCGKNA